jgi:hypothetical protein
VLSLLKLCDRNAFAFNYQYAQKYDTLHALSNLAPDDIHDVRLQKGTQITELITFTRNDFAHNAAHDLRRG